MKRPELAVFMWGDSDENEESLHTRFSISADCTLTPAEMVECLQDMIDLIASDDFCKDWFMSLMAGGPEDEPGISRHDSERGGGS